MYKIIGADQREYGPVTADQLNEWIAEGRARGTTLVQATGESGWRPLSNFPEFAAALGARTVPPIDPVPPMDVDSVAAPYLNRRIDFDIGRYLSLGWKLVMQDFWLLVGATTLVTLILFGLEALPFIGPIAGTVLFGVFFAGLDLMFLRRMRGQPATVGDAFAAFNFAFLPAAIAGTLWQVLSAVGLIFCIVPGVYLFVAWSFCLQLVIDKRMDFWPAMELSRKIAHRYWWQLFLLTLLSIVIWLAGLVALLVGFFVAFALTTAAFNYVYEDLFGDAPATAAAPPAAAA